jgi:hypothetical protein
MKERELEERKQPYEKPHIEIVQLVPEESVLQTCKTGGGEGPGGRNCITKPGGPCLRSQPS